MMMLCTFLTLALATGLTSAAACRAPRYTSPSGTSPITTTSTGPVLPTSTRTLTIYPFRTVACEQSFDPFDASPPPAPLNFTTSSGSSLCRDAPYPFGSYVFYDGGADASVVDTTTCRLDLFEAPGCAGAGAGAGAAAASEQVRWGAGEGCVVPGVQAQSAMLLC